MRRSVASIMLALSVLRVTSLHAATSSSSKPFIPRQPNASTQVQKSSEERGINPCMTPDPGYGVYEPWSRAPSMGQMILPGRGGVAKNGDFDVMLHFHGHEAVRKEWVRVMDGPVLVGIDLGLGSGVYEQAFASPEAWKTLIESVEAGVAKARKLKRAHARRIGLSAWSAGYGAIQSLLGQPAVVSRIDSVVLLDGLHGSYVQKGAIKTLDTVQLGAFIRFAQLAARGRKFMFVSHSSIIPPGYASTTETAELLVDTVGGKASSTKGKGPMGLDLIRRFNRGNFIVRGYSGNDTMDHCAHIGLFRDVLKRYVRARWKTPRGFKK
ncbi:MAG: hypothetical protein SFV15_13255 [Polyangiaceae bacterium]|nr:hypothetical protein [Polyangiaceae bacterium]